MPSFTNTALVALAFLGAVSAAPILAPTPVIAGVARAQPTGWATGYLEDYATYHLRYLALDCQSQHNTTFFTTCCSPLLAVETLASRPDECTPTETEVSSASEPVESATTTAGSDEDDDIYCDEATSVAAQVSSVAAEIASTATASVSVVTLVSSYTASASGTASASAAAVTETVAVVQADYVVASTSTSSSAWTPTSTSTKEEKHSSSTSTTAAAATSSASSGGSGTTYTGGEATYFYQNGVAGECGTVHTDEDYVIAIDSNGWWSDYMTNADSPYCGKSIVITNSNNGKTVTAVVADVCPTCTSDNSLDLSVAAFTAIASESDGMVPITWQWA